jgi:hypothetical protein
MALAAGLLWPVSVFSQTPEIVKGKFINAGNELIAFCSGSEIASQTYCFGYIEAIVDAFGLFDAKYGERLFCVTQTVNLIQVKDVVMQYFVVHPERRQFSAAGEALKALQAAFPCK